MSGISRIYSKKEIAKLEDKILKADNKVRLNTFLLQRLLITVLSFVVILYYTQNYIYPILGVLIIYYLITYLIIEVPYQKRIRLLEKEGLEFFNVLALTLENNKNLERSIEITTDNIDSNLSDEFRKCLFELKFGKSLNEALINLKKRIPSETVNSIILNIIETNNLGGNIIESLTGQVELLREKQIQYTKEQINKIPNKISIISVLFILPLMLLMILGPMILKLMGGLI